MKSVYCIIVTYNGIQWIDKCLNSILASSHPVHTVVIDNGSHDNTTSVIRNSFPMVHLVESTQNLGFGQANNKGFCIAVEKQADYLFLLNQDAWIEPDTISTLIHCHEQNPQFGIISPVHLNGVGTAMDIYFADYFAQSDGKGIVTANTLVNTRFVNAAAWLITRDCLVKTGGFDPIFFHYGEDRNYAQRALFWGFKIGITTSTRICHDREIRLAKKPDRQSILKKEWIHFLNQACDVNQHAWKVLMIRRFLRYSLQLLAGLLTLNKDSIQYNFYMANNIMRSVSRIRRSRNRSVTTGSIPHLQQYKK
jgi:GT2 family glycosyltransferase